MIPLYKEAVSTVEKFNFQSKSCDLKEEENELIKHVCNLNKVLGYKDNLVDVT